MVSEKRFYSNDMDRIFSAVKTRFPEWYLIESADERIAAMSYRLE